MTPDRLEQRCLCGLAVVYLALALCYNIVIPPRMGPDEPRHLDYVQRLVEQHALPRLDADGKEVGGATIFHPPLYYALLAPVYVAFRPLGPDAAARAMRCCSPLFVGLALVLCWLSLRRLWPERRALRLSVVASMAFLPHVQMEAAVVNNDTAAILAGALLVWQLVRLQDRWPTDRDALGFGLVFAVFLNTKGQAVPLLPLWLVWVLVLAPREGVGWATIGRVLLLGYLPMLLLGSPWYLYNISLYGSPFPPLPGNWQVIDPISHQPIAGRVLLMQLLTFLPGPYFLIYRAVFGLFITFWCQEGWLNPPFGWKLYDGLLLFSLVALAGTVKLAWQARRSGGWWWRAWPPALRAALATVAVIYGYIVGIATFVHIGFYEGGRYLLPVVVGLLTAVGLGLEAAAPSARARWWLLGSFAAFILLLNVFCLHTLLTVLNPRFAPAWRPFGG